MNTTVEKDALQSILSGVVNGSEPYCPHNAATVGLHTCVDPCVHLGPLQMA